MRVDDRGFVSLAQALRDAPSSRVEPAVPEPELQIRPGVDDAEAIAHDDRSVADEARSLSSTPTLDASTGVAAETAVALRSARVFTAALADACDALLGDLLRAIAVEIVGRELQLAAVDVAAVVRRLIAERRADAPLRVRVAPADGSISCELPVVIDPALEPGDAVLECRAGGVDARLSVRLALLVERFA